MIRFLVLIGCLSGISGSALFAQFQTNSDAILVDGHCYQLTAMEGRQTGTIWTIETVDLRESFDTTVWVHLGNHDEGGDGLVFAFHSGNISLGNYNGTLAYEGLPSILGIEVDTHSDETFNDPAFDHLAITRDGNLDHKSTLHLAGPVALSDLEAEVEDGKFHSLRVSWRPPDKLEVFWDCEWRLSYSDDIVKNIFAGNPLVRWGFTSGTRIVGNRHLVCIGGLPLHEQNDRTVCKGGNLLLSTQFEAERYRWTPDSTLTNSNIRNPVATPARTTTYFLAATDACNQLFADTVTVFIGTDSLQLDFGGDTVLCNQSHWTMEIEEEVSALTWSDGSNANSLTVSESGIYGVLVETETCESHFSKEILFKHTPSVVGFDTIICSFEEILLDLTNSGSSYFWSDSTTVPTKTISDSGTFSVRVTNACGSTFSDFIVSVQTCDQIYLPNAFSPNGDGVNDYFALYSSRITQVERLEIFDRWGKLVFEGKDIATNTSDAGWDGKINGAHAQAGVYLYKLHYLSAPNQMTSRAGALTLLR